MSIDEFFRWAKDRGLTSEQIATDLGYHFVTVYRIKSGYIKDTTNFARRAVLFYGDPVRPFFCDVIPVAASTPDRSDR